MLREKDGKVSTGRVLSVLIVLCYLVYAGYIVWHTKVMPDIPSSLATLCGAFYGVNKLAEKISVQIGK